MDKSFNKKLFDSVAASYFEETPFVHWSLTGFLMAVKPLWAAAVLSKELLATLKKRYLTILNTIITDENRDADQRNMAKFLAEQKSPTTLKTLLESFRLDEELAQKKAASKQKSQIIALDVFDAAYIQQTGNIIKELDDGEQSVTTENRIEPDLVEDNVPEMVSPLPLRGESPSPTSLNTEPHLFTPHKRQLEEEKVKRYVTDLPLICTFDIPLQQLKLLVGPELSQQIISVRSRNPYSWTPAIMKYLDKVFSESTGRNFEAAIQSLIAEDDNDKLFGLYCKKILVDFYHLVDCNPSMSRNVSERKFTVYSIASLFKFYEATFGTMSFEWIETHERAAKIAKSATTSGIVKVDSKGIRLSDNQEIFHLEVAGPPSNYTTRHVIGDTKKTLRTDILNLVSLLRNHLDCKIELATRLKVFSSLVIGDRLTLYSMNMLEDGNFFAAELATTTVPFTFGGRTKYKTILRLMGIFHDELLMQAAILEEINREVLRPETKTVRDILRVPKEIDS